MRQWNITAKDEMKKLLFFLACAAMMISFAACSGSDNNDPEESTQEGVIKGIFSIRENSQVYFSKGNLRATTTDFGASWIWEFAEHQWDYVGNKAANNAINGNGKVLVNGTVDLFGWSTPANNYGISKSLDDGVYYGYYPKDWGENIGNGWCTLSYPNWIYLFHERAKADELFGFGSVNGVNGTIILPDDWTLPVGATFNSAKDMNLAWRSAKELYYNSNENNFSHNAYTVEQWSVMESAGAVFLPAAGYRNNTGVSEVGSEGYYWSSTPRGDDAAYDVTFNSLFLYPGNYSGRGCGFSVRLVKVIN